MDINLYVDIADKNKNLEVFLVLTYTCKEKSIGLPFWQFRPQDTKPNIQPFSYMRSHTCLKAIHCL